MTRGRSRARGWLLPALVACASCGSGTSLEGSLSDEVPLAFDTVSLEQSGTAIAVIYLKAVAGTSGNDTVLKVTADTTGLKLDAPLTIALTDLVGTGTAIRGAVSRAVHDDPRKDFPPMVHGFLVLHAAPKIGSNLSGSFSVTFGQGGSLGNGKTAFGDFSGALKAAGQ